jgi:hypothetical protein
MTMNIKIQRRKRAGDLASPRPWVRPLVLTNKQKNHIVCVVGKKKEINVNYSGC